MTDLQQRARRIADKLNAAIGGVILPRPTQTPTIQIQLDEARRLKDSRNRVIYDLHYLSQVPLSEIEARFADTSTAELIEERRHYAQHGVFRGEPISSRWFTAQDFAHAVQATREAIEKWRTDEPTE